MSGKRGQLEVDQLDEGTPVRCPGEQDGMGRQIPVDDPGLVRRAQPRGALPEVVHSLVLRERSAGGENVGQQLAIQALQDKIEPSLLGLAGRVDRGHVRVLNLRRPAGLFPQAGRVGRPNGRISAGFLRSEDPQSYGGLPVRTLGAEGLAGIGSTQLLEYPETAYQNTTYERVLSTGLDLLVVHSPAPWARGLTQWVRSCLGMEQAGRWSATRMVFYTCTSGSAEPQDLGLPPLPCCPAEAAVPVVRDRQEAMLADVLIRIHPRPHFTARHLEC
jgi:hypothetical protein